MKESDRIKSDQMNSLGKLSLLIDITERFRLYYQVKTVNHFKEIMIIGHGTLMFAFGGKVIHVDPWTKQADYSALPKADMILLTHEHFDHLDAKALKTLRTEKTVLILTETCASQRGHCDVQRGCENR
ncbi:MAG TPA: MBL fold metallo-hydrolase [Desulfobacterales bacterium]|nr:MBL fold metallo-hydrolase [Desulfobacterales bacterium]